MNRDQKRKLRRKLSAEGHTIEQINKLIYLKEKKEHSKSIPEGQKVKLDIDQIKSNPDWNKMRKSYKQFVTENENVIFTVEYEETHKGNELVCLKEDTTNPKWYFWVGDLIPIEECR